MIKRNKMQKGMEVYLPEQHTRRIFACKVTEVLSTVNGVKAIDEDGNIRLLLAPLIFETRREAMLEMPVSDVILLPA